MMDLTALISFFSACVMAVPALSARRRTFKSLPGLVANSDVVISIAQQVPNYPVLMRRIRTRSISASQGCHTVVYTMYHWNSSSNFSDNIGSYASGGVLVRSGIEGRRWKSTATMIKM
ncbi:uncharacterized protein EV420DRAFT_1187841 [Desarmillaria tabescens]|uniref:Uncharacterized protein n=1 Tax=Armillaria tabescens TaxID=1929756 RepID=A0AA39T3T4_ARMTA|nr:uncharacterized protein EV420DRAFT_1187841 [Desarmillaria tabescens]KAK0462446.1 hypothetical protein EV420DRAFT_1187841 [Desarmillaria tabescens]